MTAPACTFFRRPYPSANVVLLHGPRPVLVDSGYGPDVDALESWLAAQGVAPGELSLLVNTHHHSDHVGGNHRLQSRHGVPVAAEAGEGAAVNRRDKGACDAAWLRQRVESYTVQRLLRDGDVVETGAAVWQVIATPGHTRGHISLWSPEARVLIAGDVLHADDVGWVAPCHDGPDAPAQLLRSVERLDALGACIACSGHGAPIADPARACRDARARLLRWQADPSRAAWHACKRIFAHALIVEGGFGVAEVPGYLLGCPWFRDHARRAFAMDPAAFVPLLTQEMLRAGAARVKGSRMMATAQGSGAAGYVWSGATDPSEW